MSLSKLSPSTTLELCYSLASVRALSHLFQSYSRLHQLNATELQSDYGIVMGSPPATLVLVELSVPSTIMASMTEPLSRTVWCT